jgi:prolyl-tRNA editing enzyme YbaK/EbsC (Cys-tRNA(Pro) deacylase)
MPELHPNSQAVDATLAAARVPGRVRILDEPAPTAPAAAAQLGCEVGAIANSLVFQTEAGEPLLIMTSGRHRVDLDRMAAAYGIRLQRAAPEFVRTHTGQPIGGVSPVGHPRPIRTLVDRALADYPQLWAAGGIPHAVFPLTYAELLSLTGGEEVDVD